MISYSLLQGHYLAHHLTLAGSGDESLTRSLAAARVDMNPHQVDASLFALRSPLSKGVLLADEVGLGNGRIGRLLITLYLLSKGVLQKPSLYLSDFFERNRSSYIDGLMRVRTAGDLNQWVRFFLAGVLEIATKGRETFEKILALKDEVETQCLTLGKRAPNARKVLDLLYQRSIVTAKNVELYAGVTTPTANALIRDLIALGILEEVTGQRRDRLYVFNRYLRLFLS